MLDFLGRTFHAATSFVARNWRQIVVIAATVAVGIAVTVLTGGLGAPLLVAGFAGGLASGATGYTLSWLLTPHRPAWSWSGFARATLLSGALGAATAGLGEVSAPFIGKAVSAVVPKALSKALPAATTAAANRMTGSMLGAGSRLVFNLAEEKDLREGIGLAATVGGTTATVAGPVAEAVVTPNTPAAAASCPPEPSVTSGLTGALDGVCDHAPK